MSTKYQKLPHTGIDTLLEDHKKIEALKSRKVGLIANQASLTSSSIPTATALQKLIGPSLTCLFVPEHGWSARSPEGEDIENSYDPTSNLPVLSLYGPLFDKNVAFLKDLDFLIIDLQDVGVRCYTYAATCAKVLEHISLHAYPIEIIICERPNPLDSQVKDFVGKSTNHSLVNYLQIPFQHGKTLAQLLENHNSTLPPSPSLSVIPCTSEFDPSYHHWIPPSPGLPDWEAVFLYPGLVLLEGTNISEGRGSAAPFKCVAAPHLSAHTITTFLNKLPNSGIHAHPLHFTPDTGKHKGQLCQGAQIHITNYQQVDGLRIGLSLLHMLIQHDPLFNWTSSQNGFWIDALSGNSLLRETLHHYENAETLCTRLA